MTKYITTPLTRPDASITHHIRAALGEIEIVIGGCIVALGCAIHPDIEE